MARAERQWHTAENQTVTKQEDRSGNMQNVLVSCLSGPILLPSHRDAGGWPASDGVYNGKRKGETMLRFRTSTSPSRYYTQGLVVALAALLVVIGAMLVFLWWAERVTDEPPEPPEDRPPAEEAEEAEGPDERPMVQAAYRGEPQRYIDQRRRMIERDLLGRDIDNHRVLAAMGRVARQRFVPEDLETTAYADHPLPIGHDQTISQPYIVALMTQLAEPRPTDRALDVGTGSGYQAAVLAELCKEVYGIEILEPLAEWSADRLAELDYDNVTVRHGDGFRGWPEKAPFDVIIVAAAPPDVPEPLIDQLAPGGRLVIPVGRHFQQLLRLRKRPDGTVERDELLPVRFVPMTGEAQKR